MNFHAPLARRMDSMKASEIRELLKLVDREDVISFAGGIPDPALFPADAARAAYARALGEPGALQYGLSEGYAPLRAWLAQQMTREGVAAGPENILVTAGSQQGLDFLGKALLSPGDAVACERPTYLGALQAFSAYEPRYVRLGEAGQAVYLVPDFANPTGLTMSLEAREAALAQAGDGFVIEDAAYRALRFEGETLPSLQSLDVAARGSLEASRVVYLGTFSKTVAPGMRVGWICAPRALISKLTLINQASALHVSSINQMAMLGIVEREWGGLVVAARAHYRVKRDAMLGALTRHMSGLTWTKPEGGLFVWLTLPKGVDAGALLTRAIADGVAFVPGRAFHADGGGGNTLRLSYSLPSPDRIEEGVRRLAGLVW